MTYCKREEVWKRTASGGILIGTVISNEWINPQDDKPWVVLSIRGCVALSDVGSLRSMKELYSGEELNSEHSGDTTVAHHTIEGPRYTYSI